MIFKKKMMSIRKAESPYAIPKSTILALLEVPFKDDNVEQKQIVIIKQLLMNRL